MENYKEYGPTLFQMSVPFSPAKRLGVPEEVWIQNNDLTPILTFFNIKLMFFFIVME